MEKKATADDVEALIRQLKWLIVGFVVIVFVPMIVYAIYMHRRLEAYEDSLRYQPPPEDEAAASATDGDFLMQATEPVQGQVVYVPAYSHVYHGDGDSYLLTITLSVRNTSPDDAIVVKSVRYFDSKGNEIKTYLKKPIRLGALATSEFLVERDDASGGSGANFLVEWIAESPVTAPIIETVMIDTDRQQGISFARRGTVIREVVSPTPADANESTLTPDGQQN